MESEASSTEELYEPLVENMNRLYEYRRGAANLRGHEAEAIKTFREALRGRLNLKSTAFRYLAMTSTEFTVALVDDLVIIAGNDGDFGSVAELLGRLAHDEAQKIVPPAAFKRLESDDPELDSLDWYRMADLFHYLGLHDALRELIAKARDHIDGDVRGVVDAYPDF